jgi:hypothetical protein
VMIESWTHCQLSNPTAMEEIPPITGEFPSEQRYGYVPTRTESRECS